jgi:hypothetical protein
MDGSSVGVSMGGARARAGAWWWAELEQGRGGGGAGTGGGGAERGPGFCSPPPLRPPHALADRGRRSRSPAEDAGRSRPEPRGAGRSAQGPGPGPGAGRWAGGREVTENPRPRAGRGKCRRGGGRRPRGPVGAFVCGAQPHSRPLPLPPAWAPSPRRTPFYPGKWGPPVCSASQLASPLHPPAASAGPGPRKGTGASRWL